MKPDRINYNKANELGSPEKENIKTGLTPSVVTVDDTRENVMDAVKQIQSIKYVASTGLNLRQSPDITSEVILVLVQNEPVEVTSCDVEGWAAVNTTEGIDGFVMAEYLEERD